MTAYDIFETSVFGNRIWDYILSLGLFLIAYGILKIIESRFISRLQTLAVKTQTLFDDFLISLIKRFGVPAAYLIAFYLSIKSLHLSPGIHKALNMIGPAIITVFATRVIVAFLNYGAMVYLRQSGKSEAMETSFRGMLRIAKVIIWGLAIVLFLDNMGFKISAVIAGLGIGGVAVALAAQAILGDLFSYVAILFDRPFEVGDFIIVDDYLGVVEKIGIKTTRISSLWGEELIFSNTDLTNSRVKNYKRMKKRRVLFKLGVTYDTPLEKLKEIPGIIKAIIESVKETTFDRAHFLAYGDFNLVFEVVYFVDGSDYNKYMDIQQEVNFKVKEAFQERGIEFAFPTQTLYLNKTT